MTNENLLIKRCIKNDGKAQEELYRLYAPKMYVVSLRYSKTTFEAEDVLQEAFVKIFENISAFKQECPLEFWIKRIVINTALKQNRRKIEQALKEDVYEMTQEPSEELLLSDINFKELLAVIQSIPLRYQAVFNLYAIEGYRHKEISEMLGISEGASKSQYFRAKAMIQEMLQKEEERVYETSRRF